MSTAARIGHGLYRGWRIVAAGFVGTLLAIGGTALFAISFTLIALARAPLIMAWPSSGPCRSARSPAGRWIAT